jgi:predicted transcriptional regulator
MISIELDHEAQARLDKLARLRGQDGAALARLILLDYLDFHALPQDSKEAWAEASAALTPEIIEPEDWQPDDHESQ